MNKNAKAAYDRYKQLVRAWTDVNPSMAEAGHQLIMWIEDNLTHSDVNTRQEVKAVNWESLLSVFPTEALQQALNEREIQSKVEVGICSDSPVCPGCCQYMEIGRLKRVGSDGYLWVTHCECIIGDEITIPYQETREEAIKAQNEAILKYQSK